MSLVAASNRGLTSRCGEPSRCGVLQPRIFFTTFLTAVTCFWVCRWSTDRTCNRSRSAFGGHRRAPWPLPTESKVTAPRLRACGDPRATSWIGTQPAASSRIGVTARGRDATYSARQEARAKIPDRRRRDPHGGCLEGVRLGPVHYPCMACMFFAIASSVARSSSAGLNWTNSLPASAFGVWPGGT